MADNLAVGLLGSLQANKQVYPYQGVNQGQLPVSYEVERTSSARSIGPFARYYKMIGEKAGFYGQLAGEYQSGRSSAESNDPFFENADGKLRGTFATLTPGFVFFPAPKIGLELTSGNLGYHNTKNTQEATRQSVKQEIKSSGFGAYFGLQNLNIGASFYLGGK